MVRKQQTKSLFWSLFIAVFFLLPTPVMAEKDTRFQRIEQPLTVKILVTAGGVGLIGLELWWFLFSNNKTNKKSPRE